VRCSTLGGEALARAALGLCDCRWRDRLVGGCGGVWEEEEEATGSGTGKGRGMVSE
jgi:hypothetical protein